MIVVPGKSVRAAGWVRTKSIGVRIFRSKVVVLVRVPLVALTVISVLPAIAVAATSNCICEIQGTRQVAGQIVKVTPEGTPERVKLTFCPRSEERAVVSVMFSLEPLRIVSSPESAREKSKAAEDGVCGGGGEGCGGAPPP